VISGDGSQCFNHQHYRSSHLTLFKHPLQEVAGDFAHELLFYRAGAQLDTKLVQIPKNTIVEFSDGFLRALREVTAFVRNPVRRILQGFA
jgi:hypothetical protein